MTRERRGGVEAEQIVKDQEAHTVRQELAGQTVRMATLVCPCGWERALVKMYRCFYCDVWFCELCANEHFTRSA